MNSEIPPNVVSSLNDKIMEGAPSTIIEVIEQQVEELSQVVCNEWFITYDLRNEMSNLQKRFIATIQCSEASSFLPSSDPSLQTSDREMSERRAFQRDVRSREQEIVMKGIERLEKQILQYINV